MGSLRKNVELYNNDLESQTRIQTKRMNPVGFILSLYQIVVIIQARSSPDLFQIKADLDSQAILLLLPKSLLIHDHQ